MLARAAGGWFVCTAGGSPGTWVSSHRLSRDNPLMHYQLHASADDPTYAVGEGAERDPRLNIVDGSVAPITLATTPLLGQLRPSRNGG